ncbi:hypothetical protein [Nocardia wallacei]|uniref:Uncharacterized protein n=1 Tax=Nocardia wallacei TaxID=480035 RepID=A0A7G1KQ54_9NOCA|nr:hypothetical protein [Nocardia wallacei]BCK57395.1 hypothetical protein NWFMUON74_51670 [Nocardia wallacei]
MHREHEEAMRADFAAVIGLRRTAETPGVTGEDRHRDRDAELEISKRWLFGPHGHQWAYLKTAYADWRQHPAVMTEFLDRVEDQRAHGHDAGLSDAEHRSQYQARQLTGRERARSPIPRTR